MPTVIETPGDPDANSYVTVAEANTYMGTRLLADAYKAGAVDKWTAASDPVKEAAVIQATTLMDASLVWTGQATYDDQALAWPRMGMSNRNGYPIPSDEIPSALKNATAEFARSLLTSDRTADNDIVRQGITSVEAGPISLTFRDDLEPDEDGYVPKVIPDIVVRLLPSTWYMLPAENNEPLFKVL
jgi:hypothetical protein